MLGYLPTTPHALPSLLGPQFLSSSPSGECPAGSPQMANSPQCLCDTAERVWPLLLPKGWGHLGWSRCGVAPAGRHCQVSEGQARLLGSWAGALPRGTLWGLYLQAPGSASPLPQAGRPLGRSSPATLCTEETGQLTKGKAFVSASE